MGDQVDDDRNRRKMVGPAQLERQVGFEYQNDDKTPIKKRKYACIFLAFNLSSNINICYNWTYEATCVSFWIGFFINHRTTSSNIISVRFYIS